jgi:hypothetical protein
LVRIQAAGHAGDDQRGCISKRHSHGVAGVVYLFVEQLHVVGRFVQVLEGAANQRQAKEKRGG